MGLYANVYWYINSSKWGVYEDYWYADLLAMSTAAQVAAKLNQDPTWYYATLLSWGHMYWLAIANSTSTAKYYWSDGSVEYDSSTLTWSVVAKPYQVFTISWTETKSWASNVTYSDDAAWLSSGDKAFDEFFGYYGCRLDVSTWKRYNWSGTEITDDSAYDYTTLMNLSSYTSGNDVMVCFPKRWIKISKSDSTVGNMSTVTLSITDEEDADWYTYYAFDKWDRGTPDIQDRMFIWVYEASVSNSLMYSLSWQTTSSSVSYANYWTYANNRNTTHCSMMRWFQRVYVNYLFVMKYGSTNSSSTIWYWLVSTSKQNTWWANSLSTDWETPTYWTTANQTSYVRLFWLENWRGNVSEWCTWIKTMSWATTIYTAKWVNAWDTAVATTWTYQSTWITPSITNGRPALAMSCTPESWFVPTATYSSQDWSKWYWDWSYVNSGCITDVGGSYSSGFDAGAFNLVVNLSPSYSDAHYGSRLVYL